MSNLKNDYISASQIEWFLNCPISYKYVYVDGAKRLPPNLYMAVGSAIHEALAFNFKQKIKSRKDLHAQEVIEAFDNFFKVEIAKLSNPSPSTILTLELQGRNLLQGYIDTMAPGLQPIAVEEEFEIQLQSVDIKIKGFIDLVTEDGIIRDHKVCGKSTYNKWSQSYVDDLIQLTFYSLAYRKLFGKNEKALAIDALCRMPDKPMYKSILTQRSDHQIVVIVELLKQMLKMVDKDIWYPNLRHCKECDFRDTCPRFIPEATT